MDPKRWQRVKKSLEEARDVSPVERDAYFEEAFDDVRTSISISTR